jgi:hypothetical protein
MFSWQFASWTVVDSLFIRHICSIDICFRQGFLFRKTVFFVIKAHNSMQLIRKLVVLEPSSRKVLQRLTSPLGIHAFLFSQYRSVPISINFMKFMLLKHVLPAQNAHANSKPPARYFNCDSRISPDGFVTPTSRGACSCRLGGESDPGKVRVICLDIAEMKRPLVEVCHCFQECYSSLQPL